MATIGQSLTTPIIGTTRYEQDNSCLIYNGIWAKDTDQNDSNGSQVISSTTGDYVKFKFTGTSLTLMGYDYQLNVAVSIDGNTPVIYIGSNTYAYKCVFFSTTGLSSGTHDVTITNNGGKVYFDALDIDSDAMLVVQVGQVLSSPETGWQRIPSDNINITYDNTFMAGANGQYSHMYSATSGATIKFILKGTKIRLIFNYINTATVIIDGIEENITKCISNSNTIWLGYEKTGLEDTYHTIIITNKIADYIEFNSLDIDETGFLVPYTVLFNKCKLSASKCTTAGDYVWCRYIADSNIFGSFTEIGNKTDSDVSGLQISTSAPQVYSDGYFRFIMVGYDLQNKKKFIADRNIQALTWDVLNTAGVASGSGLPIINSNNKYTLRLLSGGISSTDTDNEWDKIIANYNLGGAILTAGDNSVWNWTVYTWTSTTNTLGSSNRTVRGSSTVSNYSYAVTSAVYGFRPVLLEENINKHVIYKTTDNKLYGMMSI